MTRKERMTGIVLVLTIIALVAGQCVKGFMRAEFAGDEENLSVDACFLIEQQSWDAFSFVDLCASVISSGSSTERLCQRIQQLEARLLFDFCYRKAVGA